MKRMTYFVMALALVLGLAQCKKEQPVEPISEGNGVHITLDVNGGSNNGTRVNVDPNGNPMVTFEQGDTIEVASNGLHVGTLIHDGTKFSGDIENATTGQPLYFYFFGNKTPQFFGEGKSNCSVYIGEQTKALPVISFSASTEDFQTDRTNYSAILQNKCSLMKFNVTTPSTAPICIDGMNNFVTVNFGSGNDGFSYSQKYDGMIKMKMKGQEGDTKTYWAIVLPQGPVEASDAYTADYSYIGTRPAIGRIEPNIFYSDGVAMTLSHYDPLGTPLTFEAKDGEATVSFIKYGSAPPINSLKISINGGDWTTYTVGFSKPISLADGDKVMFYGTNTQYAEGPSDYYHFSIDGDGYCYVYGNIMSLINEENYATCKELNTNVDYTFGSLFAGCGGLCAHPQKTLELPATTLTNYCYSQMFQDCYGLLVAPKLPATTLKEGCYSSMFEGTSLEESPVLPAPSLTSNCYSSMFNNCESLNRITCLATSGMGDNTSGWLSGVAARGTFIKAAGVPVEGDEVQLTDGLYWPRGENGIPINWTVEN